MDNESVTSDFTDKFPSTLSMLAQVKKNAMVDDNDVQLGDDFDNDKDTDNSENGQDTSGDDQRYNKKIMRDADNKSIKKGKVTKKTRSNAIEKLSRVELHVNDNVDDHQSDSHKRVNNDNYEVRKTGESIHNSERDYERLNLDEKENHVKGNNVLLTPDILDFNNVPAMDHEDLVETVRFTSSGALKDATGLPNPSSNNQNTGDIHVSNTGVQAFTSDVSNETKSNIGHVYSINMDTLGGIGSLGGRGGLGGLAPNIGALRSNGATNGTLGIPASFGINGNAGNTGNAGITGNTNIFSMSNNKEGYVPVNTGTSLMTSQVNHYMNSKGSRDSNLRDRDHENVNLRNSYQSESAGKSTNIHDSGSNHGNYHKRETKKRSSRDSRSDSEDSYRGSRHSDNKKRKTSRKRIRRRDHNNGYTSNHDTWSPRSPMLDETEEDMGLRLRRQFERDRHQYRAFVKAESSSETREMLDAKADYLAEIEAMSKRIRPRRQFTNDDSFADVQDERRRMKRLEKVDNGKTMFFKILTTVCVMIEKTATYFRPFGVTLGGWSNIVRQDQATYDSIIEEMFKTKSVPMPDDPFVKLALALVMSAVTAAMGEKIIATAAAILKPTPTSASATPSMNQTSSTFVNNTDQKPAYLRSAFQDDKKDKITNPILINFLSSKNQQKQQAAVGHVSNVPYTQYSNPSTTPDANFTPPATNFHEPAKFADETRGVMKFSGHSPGLNKTNRQDEGARQSTTSTFKVPVTIKTSTSDMDSANIRQGPSTGASNTIDTKITKTSETSAVTDTTGLVKLNNTVASVEPTKTNPIVKQVGTAGQVMPVALQVSQSSTPLVTSTTQAASHSSTASSALADPIQISITSNTVRKKGSQTTQHVQNSLQEEKGSVGTNSMTSSRGSTQVSTTGITLVPETNREKK